MRKNLGNYHFQVPIIGFLLAYTLLAPENRAKPKNERRLSSFATIFFHRQDVSFREGYVIIIYIGGVYKPWILSHGS